MQYEKFIDLWSEMSSQDKYQLAEKANTSYDYLSQIANNHRGAGAKTMQNLVKADPRIHLGMFLDLGSDNQAA